MGLLWGKSKYDGRPLKTYTGHVNGRRVVVFSSWRPGEPDRDRRDSGSRSRAPLI